MGRTQTIEVFTPDGVDTFYDLPVEVVDVAVIDERGQLTITVPDPNGNAERRATYAAGFWQKTDAEIEGEG